MLTPKRKRYKAEFKAKVALETFKERKTINELATEFSIHPSQIKDWKKEATERLVEVFQTKADKEPPDSEKLTDRLYQQIGQLQVELDWLKKKSSR